MLFGEFGGFLSEGNFLRSIGETGAIEPNTPRLASAAHLLSAELSTAYTKVRFQHRGDRAMYVHDGRSTKPLPEKEISREHRLFQNRTRNVGYSGWQIRSAQKEEDRRNYFEGRASRESYDQLAAVIAFDVQHGEAGLSLLRQR